MSGSTTAICNSFKTEILQALHDFTITTGHVFKIALIKLTPGRSYGKGTVNYSDLTTATTDEVASGSGYTTGGFAWTAAQNVTPVLSTDTAVVTWATGTPNPNWTSASFSCTGGIIYNSSASNKSVSVHDFGGTQTVTAGTLTLVLPSAVAASAIIRIA